MWKEVLLTDLPEVERFQQVMYEGGEWDSVSNLMRLMKFSGLRAFIYDDPNFTLGVSFAYMERRKWHYVHGNAVLGQVDASVAAPLFVQKCREYLLDVGVNTLYGIASQHPPALKGQILNLMSVTPGVTMTRTPDPPHEVVQGVFT
jgi:hypothetical protein